MVGLMTSDPLARLRAELDRELAVLRTAGTADTLRDIFAAAPEDIARAANAVATREKG
jgi:hypothetical protein